MQATQGDHEDQKEILDFLSRRLGAPEIVQTHISTVLLGEDRVFKMKRPVRLPYLDFSTRDQRLAMCEREIALNRRFSPGLYLGLRRVTRERDGGLALDGAGDLVEAVVEMRRFPDDCLFDALARLIALTWSPLISKFSPLVDWPVRSSASSLMNGSRS